MKNELIEKLQKENVKLKKDLQILNDSLVDDGKKITILKPRTEKISYKKWVKLGDKKYFKMFFPSREEVKEMFEQSLRF